VQEFRTNRTKGLTPSQRELQILCGAFAHPLGGVDYVPFASHLGETAASPPQWVRETGRREGSPPRDAFAAEVERINTAPMQDARSSRGGVQIPVMPPPPPRSRLSRADSPYINLAATGGGGGAQTLEEVISSIAAQVKRKYIRLADFFSDFDHVRTGFGSPPPLKIWQVHLVLKLPSGAERGGGPCDRARAACGLRGVCAPGRPFAHRVDELRAPPDASGEGGGGFDSVGEGGLAESTRTERVLSRAGTYGERGGCFD
jgi:hypothetical protein